MFPAVCQRRAWPERDDGKFPETPSTHPNIHPIMKMFHLATALTASYAFAVLAPVMVRAEEASPSSAAATSRVDPQALEVLRRMSTTLGAAKAFTYRSTNVVESTRENWPVHHAFLHRGGRAQTSRQTPRSAHRRSPPFQFLF